MQQYLCRFGWIERYGVMGMREKLIELLKLSPNCICDLCGEKGRLDEVAEIIADNLIANGVTIQKWIPVADPPKDRGLYLVTVRHWLDGKPVTREAYWNSEDWLSPERKHELTPIVTHWMPEPEAAKEGTE